jgi:hypothetical protein
VSEHTNQAKTQLRVIKTEDRVIRKAGEQESFDLETKVLFLTSRQSTVPVKPSRRFNARILSASITRSPSKTFRLVLHGGHSIPLHSSMSPLWSRLIKTSH